MKNLKRKNGPGNKNIGVRLIEIILLSRVYIGDVLRDIAGDIALYLLTFANRNN
jgi:hypothetical protein